MAILKIRTCPACGSGRIKEVRRDWTGGFKGKRYRVPNLQYHECPDCGEKIYGRDAMRDIEAHSPAFARMHVKRKSA